MTRFVRNFAVLLALPVGATAAIAQVGTITGTVRADGAGLPGATVAVAETQSGAITTGTDCVPVTATVAPGNPAPSARTVPVIVPTCAIAPVAPTESANSTAKPLTNLITVFSPVAR